MPRRMKPIAMNHRSMSKAERQRRIKAEKFLGNNKSLSDEPPKDLDKSTANYYRFIVDSYPDGVLHQVDMLMIKQLAIVCNRMHQLDNYIKKHGIILKRASGAIYVNPALKAKKTALQSFHKLAVENCLTVSSRSKLASTEDVNKAISENDPLIKILTAHPSNIN